MTVIEYSAEWSNPMKVTMNDIAKAAGVSRTTVSRVLSGKAVHQEETRQRILKLAEEMNYSPDLLARAVKTKKTGNIGVIVHNEHDRQGVNSLHIPIVEAILEEAKQNNYGSFVLTDGETETPTARTLIDRRVDGVILISTVGTSVLRRFQERQIPVVLVNNVSNHPEVPYIVFDEFQGVYEGVKRIIHNGHQRILYLGGPLTARWSLKRYEGYIAATTELGLKPEPELIQFGPSTYLTGYEKTKSLLSSGRFPSAVFAASDMMAIGAMRAIYEAGLQIPDDIEIMGFDDIEAAALMIPALSTIHAPKAEMGVKAFQILNELMAGRTDVSAENVLPTKLMIRETCK